jgi:hypothetical protein
MNTLRALLAGGRGLAPWILGLALAPFLCGIGLWLWWRITGQFDPLTRFFQFVNPVALVGLATFQVWLAARAWREFSASQTMGAVWAGLTVAALAQLSGAIIAQILAVHTPLNPWPGLASDPMVRGFGVTLAGPVHLSLLLVSFGLAIAVHRSLGWHGQLRWPDFAMILATAAFVGRQAWEMVVLYSDQLHTPRRIVPWLTDPLLLVLLVLALVLWRSAGSMRGGLNGFCWGSYALGILLTAAGDCAMWTVWSQHMRLMDASLVSWFVWMPAYGAFALGPACQMEAVRLARRSEAHRPLDSRV